MAEEGVTPGSMQIDLKQTELAGLEYWDEKCKKKKKKGSNTLEEASYMCGSAFQVQWTSWLAQG